MKTKGFLLLCLFLGIGLTQLSAQKDNLYKVQTLVFKSKDVSFGFFPVTCDGINIQLMECVGNATCELHIDKNGPIWQKWESQWSATSSSGEVFKGTELDKGTVVSIDPVTDTYHLAGTFRVIMNGSLGSHYQITLSFYFDTPWTYIWSFIDARCF